MYNCVWYNINGTEPFTLSMCSERTKNSVTTNIEKYRCGVLSSFFTAVLTELLQENAWAI